MPARVYDPKSARVSNKTSTDGYVVLIPTSAAKLRLVTDLLAVARTNNDTPAFFYRGTAAPGDDLDSLKLTAPAKDGSSGTNVAVWSGAPLHLALTEGVWVKVNSANAGSAEAHYLEEQ